MIPITVRLSNSQVDKHITKKVGTPSWRVVVPGGYASASFALESPISINDPLLAPFTKMYIYDSRNGNTLFDGRLQISGRSADEQGEVWALTAIGGSAHTLDQTAPLVYIDAQLGNWMRDVLEAQFIAPSATAGPSTHPRTDNLDALTCTWPQGLSINSSPSSRVTAAYYGFVGSGMTVGAYFFAYSTTGVNANISTEAASGVSPTYSSIDYASAFDGVGTSVSRYVVDDFPAGRDVVGLRMRRTAGGLTTLSADTWNAFYGVHILGRRMLKDGTLVSGVAGMSVISYVRASWVVADLLGRMLPQYDGANAALTAVDTHNFDQLAYSDPVPPNQVLDDLMALEPGSFWAAWESNAAGKYRFEWSTWPTTPQYEASVSDGFSNPAPTFEVYNKVRVRYKDSRAVTRVYPLTQAVPMLDDAGIVREAYIDLGDELGSAANAAQIAANFLNDHKTATSGGTLKVARPIVDLLNARMVMPWEILPGRLIRVRGVEVSADSGSGSLRDGATVFRIVSAEPNGDGTATLELDMFTRTEIRALAEVAKRRNRKR